MSRDNFFIYILRERCDKLYDIKFAYILYN